MTNNNTDLFEKEPIKSAYFKLALPVVFSMVISLVYNMVDTFFIAQTQNTDLVAGVSICAPMFTLMIALGDIFGLGGSSVISRLFGQKKDEEGKRVSGFCFYTSIICGILVAIFLLIFQTPILHLLGAHGNVMQYASSYYTYLAIGTPIIMISLTPSNLMRTEGLAVECMIGTVIGSIVNIILDPIFIFGLHMGAGGAAIATVLGNLAADIILVYFVVKKSKKLTVSYRMIKISREDKIDIFAIGIPASITNLMQSFAIALTNHYLVSYGSDKVAAMGIAMKVDMIVILVMVGFAFGAQPLLGYNYGAKNWDRLKKIIRFDIIVQLIFSIVLSIILAIFAPAIIRMFMKKDSFVTAGSTILRCLLVTTPCIGIILVFTTLFQSAGKAVQACILSISRQGIVFAASILLLYQLAGYYGVICAQAASDLITLLIAVGLYRSFARRVVNIDK
ncbi:multi antimicrobial extrusion protein (Na(+)/drug antiporter), MATE family of MDR efflux pumps [Lachnospiraceae bacterium KM106-2]|nr:multi antimicrobial extrusion protein (Na(+)/drug antiporter), MATE family of MDR efflux pumps [Lachnospiraceae bacterium KM106-2]